MYLKDEIASILSRSNEDNRIWAIAGTDAVLMFPRGIGYQQLYDNLKAIENHILVSLKYQENVKNRKKE